jgi:hypothetical protein
MKHLLLLVCAAVCCPVTLLAQPAGKTKTNKKPESAPPNTEAVMIRVLDKTTRSPIENAKVISRHSGFETKQTGIDGVVLFRNIPVGEADFAVEREGYKPEEVSFTASARREDNTFQVLLEKVSQVANKLLISGKIEDERGRRIKGAVIDIVMGSFSKTCRSNDIGAYQVEIDMNAVKYNAGTIQFSVSKNGCVINDNIPKPVENQIIKDIRLYCQDESVSIPNSKNRNRGVKDNNAVQTKEINGVAFRILALKYIPGWVQLDMEVENVTDDYEEIQLQLSSGWPGQAVGKNGIAYDFYSFSVAGSGDTNYGKTTLHQKVPLKLTMYYNGGNKPRPEYISVISQTVELNNQRFTLKVNDLSCDE